MHLYQGTTRQFIGDATQARLANLLSERFLEEFRYRPATSEVNSWRNSLGVLATVLQNGDLTDQGILVELKLPLSSKRLDVMITGTNRVTGDAAVIVELKQWTAIGRSNIPECVTVDMGGRWIDHLHPSKQVSQYQRYLADTHPAFEDATITLDACAFLHNAQGHELAALTQPTFADLLATNPSFAGDQRGDLVDFLVRRVEGPDEGNEILGRVASTAFHAHKRLLDHVAGIIRNDPEYVLLDEQLVAFNAIVDGVRSAGQNHESVVFLVKGGPGTGKSVIALNLVAELASQGLQTLHLTGSKAFTENLRKKVGMRAGAVFKYFRDTAAVEDKLDVAVLDEAHRIRTVSTSRFTPAKHRTGKAQIDDILDATRAAVFFIDDLQVVRPGEVGSTAMIREAAGKRGIEVREFQLEAQFRSNGSDAWIQWVDSTLELERTPQVLWPADDEFEFQVVGSVQELERRIRLRAGEGATARLVAGYCWPWSDPDPDDGTLSNDVQVLDWSMPWNAKAEARRLGPGIPRSDFWASDPAGLEQVGCVYTAQGFEFDYVGVIVGPDLVYRAMEGGWIGQPDQSKDRTVSRGVTREEFTRYVKSTYRVLLTRGLRGCYVYFVDAPTRDFVLSRVERGSFSQRRAATPPASYEPI
ncbi:MAG: DUF2075 domain-containing protein [Chloroflexota bacterium]